MRIGQNLGKHGHQSASQINEEVSAAVHRVFDLRAEGPLENHIPDNVRPAAMHEHRSEDGDPLMAGNDLRRNGGPLQDECVITHLLKQKSKTFATIMNAVTTGNRTGRREA
jgi:hypothetical protein